MKIMIENKDFVLKGALNEPSSRYNHIAQTQVKSILKTLSRVQGFKDWVLSTVAKFLQVMVLAF
jgi:hypothetical protein